MQKTEELVVITKTYDLILWGCNHTSRFPRQHRFVLGEHIERSLYDLLETLIQAKYTRDQQAEELLLGGSGDAQEDLVHDRKAYSSSATLTNGDLSPNSVMSLSSAARTSCSLAFHSRQRGSGEFVARIQPVHQTKTPSNAIAT